MDLPGLGNCTARQRNVGFLKQYNDHYFKLIHMNSVRLPGYEERHPKKQKARSSGQDGEKLQNSLSRTRSAVFELALCNSWDYFVTLTVNGRLHDRYDLSGTYKHIAKWFNNYNSRRGTNLHYLLVPEPHKDGAWHFHGLFSGLPFSHLAQFTPHDHIPLHLLKMIKTGRILYNWSAYAKAFGFVTFEKIQDPERCAVYMTKYITKDLQKSSIDLNYHLYYCSHGLQRATLFHRGEMLQNLDSPDFENDYVRIKRFSTPEEALIYFCDKEF